MADVEAGRDGKRMAYIDELRAARNRVRASFNDNQPFSSADLVSPPPQISGQTLPMRENVNEAAAVDQMDETADNEDDGLSAPVEVTLQLPNHTPMEKVILLPIVSMVREIYESAVMKHKREIQQFLGNGKIDTALVASLDEMVEELKLLADHQDLIIEESSTQLDASDEFRAKWALTCSCKCLFVHSFLEKMRHDRRHIAILVRPGRMLGIMESILRWYDFSYERVDRSLQSSSGSVGSVGSLKITLLPTNLTGEDYDFVTRVDTVIAFDETFRDADHCSLFIRRLLSNPQKPALLISLVVAYSAEHIELCLPKTADPRARKISLVDFITQTREDIGKVEHEFSSPDEAAAAVAHYLLSDDYGESAWPLPGIPDIVVQSTSEPVTRKTSEALNDPQSSGSVFSHGPMKRTLRAGSITGPDLDLAKRMRMTPIPADISSGGDITRVSDSMGSHSLVEPGTASSAAEDAILRAINNQQSKQITALVESISELDAKVLEKESTEEQLRKKVKELEQRLDDHMATIKRLQPRLQEAIMERGKFQAERDEANAQAANVTQAITSRNAEIVKVKEEKTHLEEQLTNALNALSNSSIPEAATLAQAQDQARTLQAEKDRLEKRITSLQHELDFTREVYQKASSHTTQLGREVSELQGVNGVLQRKASENTVRIAEIQRGNETREREGRIAELEALLRDRELELRRKSEELKVKTNGRRETRGTSVPRSPRMGASGVMRVAGGSRGASPAPGDFAHAGRERDPQLFPPSSLGSGRWGHLSG